MSSDPLGRYEILQELGRGAMGVVYKARDSLIDRVVAIKTVSLDAAPNENGAFERRFYREAKTAGRLNHRNIVTIYDVGRSGDSAYIAMEFLEGRSLREIIDSGVVLPSEEIADIAAQIADGLSCAHDNGVIHRDIKPANIMVLDNGTVKITDFGIAMLSKGSSLTVGGVFGSPKYISPEQVIGHHVDGRSDIFSLGAVLYELLTGTPAFTASDLDAVLCQVINDNPAPPTTRNKSIARAFDRIVARAMAKHPNDRYATAREMVQDLRNFRDLELPADVQISNRTLERRARRRLSSAKAVRRMAAGAEAAPAASRRGSPRAEGTARSARWQRRDTAFLGVAVTMLAVATAWAVAPLPLPKPAQPALKTAPLVPATGTPVSVDEPVRAATTDAPTLSAPAVMMSASAASPARAGRLAFAVSPWGEVYVDGKRRGISPPLQELEVPPGKHVVEIRNTGFQRHNETVDLRPEASVRIKHKFQ